MTSCVKSIPKKTTTKNTQEFSKEPTSANSHCGQHKKKKSKLNNITVTLLQQLGAPKRGPAPHFRSY